MNESDVSVGNNKITRKIFIDPAVIVKMKKLISLYGDEIPENAKEIDIISFFAEKGFKAFLESGDIERRLAEITGKE